MKKIYKTEKIEFKTNDVLIMDDKKNMGEYHFATV
jgi:hypothetical protein